MKQVLLGFTRGRIAGSSRQHAFAIFGAARLPIVACLDPPHDAQKMGLETARATAIFNRPGFLRIIRGFAAIGRNANCSLLMSVL